MNSFNNFVLNQVVTIQGEEVVLKDQLKYDGGSQIGSCQGCRFVDFKSSGDRDICFVIQANPHTSCLNHNFVYVPNTPEGIMNYLELKLNGVKDKEDDDL
jgi:hypothetical protein